MRCFELKLDHNSNDTTMTVFQGVVIEFAPFVMNSRLNLPCWVGGKDDEWAQADFAISKSLPNESANNYIAEKIPKYCDSSL